LGLRLSFECAGRTIWIADAHHDRKRFVVRADQKLTAILELDWQSNRILGRSRDASLSRPEEFLNRRIRSILIGYLRGRKFGIFRNGYEHIVTGLKHLVGRFKLERLVQCVAI
jgi:hypothetical protein